ncbi:serine hydrolase domain-containing protein [Parasphingorhabdus halotolerans]|uniref:Beta-lactamase family protein n=1 Tax=Parasphingorhabdus halotolerans TaxID=2725558 RepID=A0A6H2DM00_9SPHN|nr:serine hydrolase domain-containing protein [Parasphingorhabdus halotolerans]QJB69157.1 beta-lactamase family protein [Parasphingorhabdus halotolerans]
MSVSAIQGFSNRTTGRALMPDDPVRIASVSKLFVALAVMRLVESEQLNLDADVNDYLDWNLRNPAFPDDPITLTQLLSHQSGLRDGINYALPMDALLEQELRDPKAWDSQHRSGENFAYANLNFPVIAAIMEAATGKRFDQIMQGEVFKPLKLNACFNWINCRDTEIEHAVTLYRPNGDVARDDLRGKREACEVVPTSDGSCDLSRYQLGKTGSIFSPQGGLRISAVDLAKVGQMFLRDDGEFLSRESISKMTDPQWVYDGGNGDSEDGYFCAYGMGVHVLALGNRHKRCKDNAFGDNMTYWGHSGEAYSLKSGLWMQPLLGKGTAFFRTEVPENDPAGHCIYFCE